MANLTLNQLQQLWIKNGGSPAWAPTMAAVAYYGESGGNPEAKNSSGATGLWQTIMGAQGQAFQKQWAGADLTDPNTAAKVAIAQLGNGSGISNWGSGTGDSVGTYIQAAGNKPLTPEQIQSQVWAGAINPSVIHTPESTLQGQGSSVASANPQNGPRLSSILKSLAQPYINNASKIAASYTPEVNNALKQYDLSPGVKSAIQQTTPGIQSAMNEMPGALKNDVGTAVQSGIATNLEDALKYTLIYGSSTQNPNPYGTSPLGNVWNYVENLRGGGLSLGGLGTGIGGGTQTQTQTPTQTPTTTIPSAAQNTLPKSIPPPSLGN